MATRSIRLTPEQDALRLKALRVDVKAGVEALERGEFTEITDPDLDRYLERLATQRPE